MFVEPLNTFLFNRWTSYILTYCTRLSPFLLSVRNSHDRQLCSVITTPPTQVGLTILVACGRCRTVYTHRLTTAAHGYLATSIRTSSQESKTWFA